MASLPKSVLITGCSTGGIGQGLAEVFHERGYHVFATVRNLAKASSTLTAAENITILELDVLSSESIAATVESVKKVTDGKLDVLINNSGGTLFAPGLDVSIDDGKKLFDLNFWAPFAMLQAFAPLLIQTKGCIVNNTSANAYFPMGLMSVYNSSKAALAVASETWRRELQPLGVRTITLATCAVKTNHFSGYPRIELPQTSYYLGIQDFLHKITDGRMQDNGVSPREYAIEVIEEIEKGAAGIIWAGADASTARSGYLLPQPVFDEMIESIIPLSSEMGKAAQKV